MRLTIRGTQTGVVYTRINEFGAALYPQPTSIEELKSGNKKVNIYTVGNCIYVDAPSDMESAKIDVYTTSGSLVTSRTYDDIKMNDMLSVHSFDFVPGIYTVRFETAKGKVYTSKVAIK